MSDFAKNVEKTVDEQTEEVKRNLNLLLDEEGNVRKGVTSTQIQDATETIQALVRRYKVVIESNRNVCREIAQVNEEVESFREDVKNSRTRKYYDKMPLMKRLLGL